MERRHWSTNRPSDEACGGSSFLGAIADKDGQRILSRSSDSTLRLWDAATGRQIGPGMKHDLPKMPEEFVETVGMDAMFDGDGRRILSWSTDSTLRLWDAATGQQIGPAMKHDKVTGAMFDEGGRRLLSWSDNGTLRLWDLVTGRLVGPAMEHGHVGVAMFDSDGRRILSWSSDDIVRTWEAATGQLIDAAMKYEGNAKQARFDSDGRRNYLWNSDGFLRLRDVTTGQQIGSAMKHDHIADATFDKDDKRILSWSKDGTLRLWDASTGQQIIPAMKHDGNVDQWRIGANFDHNGRRVLSWGAGSVMLGCRNRSKDRSAYAARRYCRRDLRQERKANSHGRMAVHCVCGILPPVNKSAQL